MFYVSLSFSGHKSTLKADAGSDYFWDSFDIEVSTVNNDNLENQTSIKPYLEEDVSRDINVLSRDMDTDFISNHLTENRTEILTSYDQLATISDEQIKTVQEID